MWPYVQIVEEAERVTLRPGWNHPFLGLAMLGASALLALAAYAARSGPGRGGLNVNLLGLALLALLGGIAVLVSRAVEGDKTQVVFDLRERTLVIRGQPAVPFDLVRGIARERATRRQSAGKDSTVLKQVWILAAVLDPRAMELLASGSGSLVPALGAQEGDVHYELAQHPHEEAIAELERRLAARIGLPVIQSGAK